MYTNSKNLEIEIAELEQAVSGTDDYISEYEGVKEKEEDLRSKDEGLKYAGGELLARVAQVEDGEVIRKSVMGKLNDDQVKVLNHDLASAESLRHQMGKLEEKYASYSKLSGTNSPHAKLPRQVRNRKEKI